MHRKSVYRFDAKQKAKEIAPLWRDFVTDWGTFNDRTYAEFMAQQAFEGDWTLREAFHVDFYFQEALDEYNAEEDAKREG